MPRIRRHRLDLWRIERQVSDNWARWVAIGLPIAVAIVVLVMVGMQR